MRYIDFRDQIITELRRSKTGLSWNELREKLKLPYKTPCPEWVLRMERENGLVREKGDGRAFIWRVKSSKEKCK